MPAPAHHSKPFNQQLQHYFVQIFASEGQPHREFHETIGDDDVSLDDVRAYLKGTKVPPAHVTERMAEIFMLRSLNDFPIDRQGEREAFLGAAFRERGLKDIIEDYARKHELQTPNAIAEHIGISPRTLAELIERGKCAQRHVAAAIANKLELSEALQRHFYEKFSDGYTNDNHLIDSIGDNAHFTGMITALRDNRGFTVNDLAALSGAKYDEARSWFLTEGARQPSRARTVALAGEGCFNLTKRQHCEKFFDACGHFMDAEHVVSTLEKGKIELFDALRGFISLRAETIGDYAAHIKVAPTNVAKWGKTKAIPRQRLAELITDLPEQRQRVVMEKAGFFTDINHINDHFGEGKSNNLGGMIDAWKSTYDMSNSFTGVSGSAMTKIKNASAFTPSISILVAIFTDACSVEPKIQRSWQAYKDVAARYLGHGISGTAYERLQKDMDRELEERRTAINQTLGAFTGLVLRNFGDDTNQR